MDFTKRYLKLPVPVLIFTIFVILNATNIGVTYAAKDQNQCVMYSRCGQNPELEGKDANCLYTGPPKPLPTTKAVKDLKKVCPELVQEIEKEGIVSTCCDDNQVLSMTQSLAMGAAFFSRCPTCVRNFRQTFCRLTCSPKQSQFVVVNRTATAGDTNRTVITQLDVYVDNNYIDKIYNSCKDVANPSTNDKAIGIMCGDAGVYFCSGPKWFTFMGDPKANGLSPFMIRYVFSNASIHTVKEQKIHPLNVKIEPCNLPTEAFQSGCACQDCEDSCPVPPPLPPLPEPFCVWGWDGLRFIMCFVFLGISTVFLVFYYCSTKNRIMEITFVQTNNDIINRNPMDDVGCLEKLGAALEDFLERTFTIWGTICAAHPWTVLIVGSVISVGFSLGILFLQITTQPVDLWASPSSRSRMEKEYFDQNFSPFFRTEMMIIRPVDVEKVPYVTPDGKSEMWGPVYNETFLRRVLDLQNFLSEELRGDYDGEEVALEDICYTPLSPVNNNCTIQSVLNYFQNDASNIISNKYMTHINNCLRNPFSLNEGFHGCLGSYGGPVFGYTTLGGFMNGSQTLGDNPPYKDATALIIVFLVNNHYDQNETRKAMAWEKAYLSYMKNFSDPMMDIAYSSERAIQDELQRESRGDVFTILISYVTMFVYISVALGDFTSFRRILVDSKVTLGLGGIVIVLISVSASVGFYGYIGIPATLIIIEVIPFLVLAIGVDNMFILVQTYQREARRPSESRNAHIGRVVGQVAPSILLSGCSEIACFFLGALSNMPAVHAFALYAGLALTIDFILQVTCFVALMALDIRRQEKNRFDVLCCFTASAKDPVPQEGILYRFLKNLYAPFLLSKCIRPVVVVFFTGWLCFSIAAVPKLSVGLEQELSMPEDSFVLKYFKYMKTYLSVGPPVYFVVKGNINYTSLEEQNKICGTINCDADSLINQIYMAASRSNRSFIAQPSSSWLDDYFSWLTVQIVPPCCRVFQNGSFCPTSYFGEEDCFDCDVNTEKDKIRPTPEHFADYLPFFLEDVPSIDCPKGGKAAYNKAVVFNSENKSVDASYFMTYHTILKTSQDYYEALRSAREISENITKVIDQDGVEVFPYSIFYVFYEQYLTLPEDAMQSIGISLLTVFIVTVILSGLDIASSLVVLITITMILTNLAGLMVWWNISLNAVSLVNLVMCVGISVEFCSHITHAFALSLEESKLDRANDALVNMGSSVLSGITLTKFGGIIVLAFAHSQIFKVFYFRMYLGIVIIGAAHGLIFLPVMLSLIGSRTNRARLRHVKNEKQRNHEYVKKLGSFS